MDGNQRWAKKNNKNILDGYSSGMKKIEEVISFCLKENINHLTLYALSVENYKRNSIYLLFQLINNFYKKLKNTEYTKLNSKIRIIGERNNLPKEIISKLIEIENLTKNNKKLNLNIVFNYGTYNEIIFILKKMISSNSRIDEETFKSFMYLCNSPDPDLLIRTGGYQRLSNFILLNLSYTELFFTKTLWPELEINEINNFIKKFESTKRNYGL